MDLALQAVDTVFWESVRVALKRDIKAVKVAKMPIRDEKNSWQQGSGKKGSKRQDEGGKGDNRTCWTCGKNRRHCSVESNGRQQQLVRHW